MRQRQTHRVRGREGERERGGERVCNVTQTPASCSGRLYIHVYALICNWCVCAHVHMGVCVCAFMLYALNFDNMYL